MFRRLVRRRSTRSTTAACPAVPVESLEQRRLLAVSPEVIIASKIKVKNLFDDQGLSINQSQLTVRFSSNVTLADPTKVRMIGYVVNPVGGAQRKVTVNLSEITHDAVNSPNIITFKTDSLSPKTGRIIIDAGGVKDPNGDDIVQNVQPPKGQNKERFTLARRAFRPTDLSLFPKFVDAGGNNGTALTSENARTLRGLRVPVVLVYDGDEAGQRAAERAAELLLASGIEGSVAILEGDLDPAELVVARGPEALERAVASAAGLFEYRLARALARGGDGA